MSKTKQQIEDLKDNWRKDPCWDIEDTEGFQEHRDELLAFREQQNREWQIEREEDIAERARVVAIDTGITNVNTAQAVHTYQEIEDQILKSDKYSPSGIDLSMREIAQAQVRAMLLLTAQIQRIADQLESNSSSSDLAAIWKVTT